MGTLAEAVARTRERRADLVAELSAIDAELEEARVLLGMSRAVTRDEEPATTSGDAPIEKICEVCGKTFPQRSNRQKICAACRAEVPHRSAAEIVGVKEPDSTCERCGNRFVRAQGNAGRFCSRACYERKPVPSPAPTAAQPASSLERRCGRCLLKFKPTNERQYICPPCLEKPLQKRGREIEPELETAWTPGKDAPSLTSSAGGMGQSLAGSVLKAPR